MVRQRADIARTDRRLTLALGVSVALHGALLLANRGFTAIPAASTPLTLVARLAPAAPVPQPATEPAAPETPAKATRASTQRTEAIPSPAQPAPIATATTAPAPETAASPPPAAEPEYYPTESLDAIPKLLTKMRQTYPPRARDGGIEGSVTLELWINERGEIDQASVIKAQPRGYFEEAALAMLRGQRYSPPMKNGRAVRGRYQFTVRYRLDD
ncbi:MAG: TonB family protein [Pseudomonadota bacterium]